MPPSWDGSWHMGSMGLAWILPAMVGVVIWLALRNRSSPRGPSEDPEQVIKARYAKGEIDRETFQRMLGDIRGG